MQSSSLAEADDELTSLCQGRHSLHAAIPEVHTDGAVIGWQANVISLLGRTGLISGRLANGSASFPCPALAKDGRD